MKGLVTRNTHVKYENSTSYGIFKLVLANYKIFVYATDTIGRAMTLTYWTYLSLLANNQFKIVETSILAEKRNSVYLKLLYK